VYALRRSNDCQALLKGVGYWIEGDWMCVERREAGWADASLLGEEALRGPDEA
jgi:hypothetical protein